MKRYMIIANNINENKTIFFDTFKSNEKYIDKEFNAICADELLDILDDEVEGRVVECTAYEVIDDYDYLSDWQLKDFLESYGENYFIGKFTTQIEVIYTKFLG